jgi:hypothetical protein
MERGAFQDAEILPGPGRREKAEMAPGGG